MEYKNQLIEALTSLPDKSLFRLAKLFQECSEANGIIYVAGNGGSATIADHFVCDYNKSSVHGSPFSKRKAFCFDHSLALTSALHNDFSDKEVFSWQVNHFCNTNDLFVAISSSGNSKNLINAIATAKGLGIQTISLTGMEGGEIRKSSNYNLHVESNNYGIIEDCHMSALHLICQLEPGKF